VNDELLTMICDLNADVARMRRCWRPDLIEACLLAYAAGLAMRCYDVRDTCYAEEAAA
jgi:hypothetical protein